MEALQRKRPDSYIDRDYRKDLKADGLVSSIIKVKDTDLQIFTDKDVHKEALDLTLKYRLQVENYIKQHPSFRDSLNPVSEDVLAPAIVKSMIAAGRSTAIGPMAAVAGAIAEYVGVGLKNCGCKQVMVENGGDIYVNRDIEMTIGIFAGESPLSMNVGIKIDSEKMPLGICTSSGTVGHSLSFGVADSVTVMAKSTPLADAAATRLGNEVGGMRGGTEGIEKALEVGRSLVGVDGIVVVCGEKIGAVGDVELVRLN